MLPALLGAALVALVLFATVAGGLWLFVFGDNPWPAWADAMLTAGIALSFLGFWAGFLALAYQAGRKQESRAAFDAKHAWAAAAISIGVILVMLLYSWRVGNIGPPTVVENCSSYCRSRGYAGSGTPPKNAPEQTCSCYDAQGREALKLPLGDLAAPGARDAAKGR